MSNAIENICRLPAADDNVAIATQRIEAGTAVSDTQAGENYSISHTILEGHRFVVRRIYKGERLLSWGLPFGTALRDIEPGEYVCNAKILAALAERDIDFDLPAAANFEDYLEPYHLDQKPSFQVIRSKPSTTVTVLTDSGVAHRAASARATSLSY